MALESFTLLVPSRTVSYLPAKLLQDALNVERPFESLKIVEVKPSGEAEAVPQSRQIHGHVTMGRRSFCSEALRKACRLLDLACLSCCEIN